LLGQSASQLRRARDLGARDLQPLRVFYRANVSLTYTDTVRGHVVHEEVREMFRGHNNQGFGAAGDEILPLLLKVPVKLISHRSIFHQVSAAGDSWAVAQNADIHQAHDFPPA
jgi:hypothetical protein